MAIGAGFCDRFPRFLETTETIPSTNRLNCRYRAVIAANAKIFAGQRVLDLGSHDGRWSFAALEAGARHVTGIEARPRLLEKANDNFSFYKVDRSRYRFILGEALAELSLLQDNSIDIMMCLGFFYHTLGHTQILLEARRLGARYIIMDTGVTGDAEPLIRLLYEPVSDARMSVDYSGGGRSHALVGVPSRAAVTAMLDYADYEAEFFDWHDGSIVDWTDIEDYRTGRRVTLLARRRG